MGTGYKRYSGLVAFVLLIIMVFMQGCTSLKDIKSGGSDETPTIAPPAGTQEPVYEDIPSVVDTSLAKVQGTIGTEGGQITLDDGASLTFAPSALTQQKDITPEILVEITNTYITKKYSIGKYSLNPDTRGM